MRVGDVVRRKGTDVEMTVERVTDGWVHCTWYHDYSFHAGVFPLSEVLVRSVGCELADVTSAAKYPNAGEAVVNKDFVSHLEVYTGPVSEAFKDQRRTELMKLTRQWVAVRDAKDKEIDELRGIIDQLAELAAAQQVTAFSQAQAITELNQLKKEAAELKAENAQRLAERNNICDEAIRYVEQIAAKDARIAELDTELAQLRRSGVTKAVINPGGTFDDGPARTPQPPSTPHPGNPPLPSYPVTDAVKPPHNPFRDFPTDPRRMGPG